MRLIRPRQHPEHAWPQTVDHGNGLEAVRIVRDAIGQRVDVAGMRLIDSPCQRRDTKAVGDDGAGRFAQDLAPQRQVFVLVFAKRGQPHAGVEIPIDDRVAVVAALPLPDRHRSFEQRAVALGEDLGILDERGVDVVHEPRDVDLGRRVLDADRGIDRQLDHEKDHDQRAGHDGYALPAARLDHEEQRADEHRKENAVLPEQHGREEMQEQRPQQRTGHGGARLAQAKREEIDDPCGNADHRRRIRDVLPQRDDEATDLRQAGDDGTCGVGRPPMTPGPYERAAQQRQTRGDIKRLRDGEQAGRAEDDLGNLHRDHVRDGVRVLPATGRSLAPDIERIEREETGAVAEEPQQHREPQHQRPHQRPSRRRRPPGQPRAGLGDAALGRTGRLRQRRHRAARQALCSDVHDSIPGRSARLGSGLARRG